jgi:hypothetical protein
MISQAGALGGKRDSQADRRLMRMSLTNLTNYIEQRCRLYTDMAPQGPALGYGSPSPCRVRKPLSTRGPAVSDEMFPP